MRHLRRLVTLAAIAAALHAVAPSAPVAAPAEAAERLHAIAMHGAAREPKGFAHLSYVNPAAPKGGRIVLGVNGAFDSLNPLIVKGVAAQGMREYVIESLLARGGDEPFTLYGLLAESVEMPPDRSAITFHLDPRAAFSDGKPVTADDVIFSFEVLRERGRPNFRTYYRKVATAERISDRAVRFVFKPEEGAASGNAPSFDREMPLIMGLMPVLARHAFEAETFDRTTLNPFVSSGPYRIASVEAGRSVVYERNPDYWGRDLPVNRGRFNFDEIRFDYYRDAASMFEAFKTGAIDLRNEEDPARWATGYKVPAAEDGRIARRALDIGIPAGMTGLVFNTRRPLFADRRVREAFSLLFDFEFANKALYNGLFKRTESFFERSVLSSAGRPADAAERALLAPFKDAVAPAVLDGTYRQPQSDGSGQNRDAWRRALALLKAAGYEQQGGRLVETASGRQLAFEILAASTAQERLLLAYTNDLKRLGIDARLRVVDPAQYQARLTSYDFDMIQNTWPSSLSPGNEQLFRWSSRAADVPGTFNFAGVKSAAADALISEMLQAETEDSFVAAVRALDRVLLSGTYVIPLFHVPKQWIAHWRHLKGPERTPVSGLNLETWWVEGEK